MLWFSSTLLGFANISNPRHQQDNSTIRMRLSNICVTIMAMASSVFGQSEDCNDFDPNDIQPGHLGGISKLPHEIVSSLSITSNVHKNNIY